ncbi:ergothioneine biosynthesis protein EgtB [Bacteriovoracaceae bacterium]|nr:ergothioneine biosynthesis protein EgtB [Bacteriovoracaceae bacterium]
MKLLESYVFIRNQSKIICEKLEVEDYVVQPAEFVSPPKWHLAHTSWFFENIILKKYLSNYRVYKEEFDHLFNSYYKSLGSHWMQSERGFLSRPTVKEVYQFREHVDAGMTKLLSSSEVDSKIFKLIEIGLHHEQQHQELLLMDIKYILGLNPSMPALSHNPAHPYKENPEQWSDQREGVFEFGTSDKSKFSFDNESPRHQEFIQAHQISNYFVTNGEYLKFVNDGGYNDSRLWLAKGWDWVKQNNINKPLYWYENDNTLFEYTLLGATKINPLSPVSHVNYFEADAFARWSGNRLPTEFESEIFMSKNLNLFNDEGISFHSKSNEIIFNNLWWWTSSSYQAYPGFTSFEGSLGEYNGKFMCNQYVLKGGCFGTAQGHLRETYRNFYYPEQNWMFSGIRLAN